MSKQRIQVYTLGYQGINLDEYIRILGSQGVMVVLDVRENAWSYKPGFSRGPLQGALENAGIEYIHVQSAGNPSGNRKSAASVQQCLDRYRQIVNEDTSRLDELWDLIQSMSKEGKSVCLTCYEHEPSECHRSIIIETLADQGKRFEVVHLPVVI